MRKYTADGKLEKIACNQCGRELKLEKEIPMEGVFTAKKVWGYFSEKDGEVHAFDLCEKCYDRWIRGFAVPVETREETELLGD